MAGEAAPADRAQALEDFSESGDLSGFAMREAAVLDADGSRLGNAGDELADGEVSHGDSSSLVNTSSLIDSRSAHREKLRYGRCELLELRHSDDGSVTKWNEIVEGLGTVALELHSLCNENQQNLLTKKDRRQLISKKSGVSNAVKVKEPVIDDPYVESEDAYEEYYTDSSDDDLRKPALYVDGEPDFDSGPPQDGFEFLRRVRWEEARCERVKVATISVNKLTSEQTPYMPSIPPISACDPELLPSKEWEAEFIADFSNLRKKIIDTPPPPSSQRKLPHYRDKDAWKVYCFGYTFGNRSSDDGSDDIIADRDDDCDQEHGEEGARLPYLSTLLNLDEVSRAALLSHHISWLQELENLPEHRALWLYALSAVVDEPLDADTSAAFRELLRKCALIRASRSFRDEHELQMLNIIITIAGKYFGQADI